MGVYPRRLSEEQMWHLVEQAVSGGPCLDKLFSLAVWGPPGPPEVWGDWPEEVIEQWDACVQLHGRFLRGLEDSRRKRQQQSGWSRREETALEEMWDAVLEVTPERGEWWEIANVTWRELGLLLGVTPRVAEYRMTKEGWSLEGRGRGRRVAAAPCQGCGEVHPADDIEDRHGPCCRSGQGEEAA